MGFFPSIMGVPFLNYGGALEMSMGGGPLGPPKTKTLHLDNRIWEYEFPIIVSGVIP